MLIICIFWLRKIQNDFSIIRELQVVFTAWFIGNNVSLGIYVLGASVNYYAIYFLIARSVITVLVTCVQPLWQSYKGNHYIPIPPPIDGLDKLDMVLHIPLAADAFYEYLDKLEDQEAPIFFALYADLRHYDKACT
jgi:hypothetical protein